MIIITHRKKLRTAKSLQKPFKILVIINLRVILHVANMFNARFEVYWSHHLRLKFNNNGNKLRTWQTFTSKAEKTIIWSTIRFFSKRALQNNLKI